MGGDGQGMLMGPNGMAGGRGQSVDAAGGPGARQSGRVDRRSVALMAALAIGFFVFRAITRPIDQLTRAAQQLAQGDLSARVVVDDQACASGLR